MKLNPHELVVSSFEPAAAPGEDAVVFATPICPTPNTQCFVCPAPTSPEDGC